MVALPSHNWPSRTTQKVAVPSCIDLIHIQLSVSVDRKKVALPKWKKWRTAACKLQILNDLSEWPETYLMLVNSHVNESPLATGMRNDLTGMSLASKWSPNATSFDSRDLFNGKFNSLSEGFFTRFEVPGRMMIAQFNIQNSFRWPAEPFRV